MKIRRAYALLASTVLKSVIKDGDIYFFSENGMKDLFCQLACVDEQWVYEQTLKVKQKKDEVERRKCLAKQQKKKLIWQ